MCESSQNKKRELLPDAYTFCTLYIFLIGFENLSVRARAVILSLSDIIWSIISPISLDHGGRADSSAAWLWLAAEAQSSNLIGRNQARRWLVSLLAGGWAWSSPRVWGWFSSWGPWTLFSLPTCVGKMLHCFMLALLAPERPGAPRSRPHPPQGKPEWQSTRGPLISSLFTKKQRSCSNPLCPLRSGTADMILPCFPRRRIHEEGVSSGNSRNFSCAFSFVSLRN